METTNTNKELAYHYLNVSKPEMNHERKMEALATAQVHATLHLAEMMAKVTKNTSRGDV